MGKAVNEEVVTTVAEVVINAVAAEITEAAGGMLVVAAEITVVVRTNVVTGAMSAGPADPPVIRPLCRRGLS